jgi:hypothetical protein
MTPRAVRQRGKNNFCALIEAVCGRDSWERAACGATVGHVLCVWDQQTKETELLMSSHNEWFDKLKKKL